MDESIRFSLYNSRSSVNMVREASEIQESDKDRIR